MPDPCRKFRKNFIKNSFIQVWRRSVVKWKSFSTNSNTKNKNNVRGHWGPVSGSEKGSTTGLKSSHDIRNTVNTAVFWTAPYRALLVGLLDGVRIMRIFTYAQYTPPTPTRRNCRVASRRRCEHTRRQSWPNLQFPVLTTDKWRHNDVIVEKIVKIHEYYTIQQIRMFTNTQRHMLRHILLLQHWLQNCKLGHGHRLRSHRRIRRQSSWASCEFMYRRRRRDETKTVSSRRRCVLGLTLSSVPLWVSNAIRQQLKNAAGWK